MQEPQNKLILFTLDGQKYGLDLFSVQRVLRVVEITTLPDAPAMILGVFNLEGKIIPVINTRHLLHLPARKLNLSDQLVIISHPERTVALLVDSVPGVVEYHEGQHVTVDSILPGIKHITGILKGDESLIFIQDIRQFLSFEDNSKLHEVLSHLPENPGK